MMGVPARERRIMDDEQQAYMMQGAARYVENAKNFKATLNALEEE
jgi:carbonic anhydrase/acetyltransferase-like protein (isoleucine patch superfamily)